MGIKKRNILNPRNQLVPKRINKQEMENRTAGNVEKK